MEKLLLQAIEDLSHLHKFTDEEMGVLEKADKAADALVEPEYEHYLKREVNKEAPKIARKYGLFKIPIKREYGGFGVSPLVGVLAKERLSQTGLGFGSFLSVHSYMCSAAVQNWGDDAQKERYLKPAVEGKFIFAFGLTEPEAGSDPQSMKTAYKKEGNRFIINGSKYLITNGGIAGCVIVFAKAKGSGEITAFLVDSKSDGFNVAMHLSEKVGLFTSDTAMLEFDGVEVPKENVLGGVGNGLHIAYATLVNGRMGVASSCVGIIDGALNAVASRAKERIQFGKPIGKHQLVQRHVAIIRQNLEMARWPTYFAAIRKEAYEKDMKNKDLIREMDMRSSLAKKIASGLAFDSADHAMQVFGGFGYSLLSPVGQLFCDSRVARIYEGTDEIQELKIAASVLGDDFRAFE